MWNWTIPGKVIEMFVWNNDCEQDLPSLMGASMSTGEPAFYTVENMSDHGVDRCGNGLLIQHNGGLGSARFHLGNTWGSNGMPHGVYKITVDCYRLSPGGRCYLRLIADAATSVYDGLGFTWTRLSVTGIFTGGNFWIDLIFSGSGVEKAFWDNIRVEKLFGIYPIMHMNTRQVCRRVGLVQ